MRTVKLLFIFISLSMILPLGAIGTIQSKDKLDYKGQTHHVSGFNLSNELLLVLRKFKQNSQCYVEISSNWDGFHASLSIRDNKLIVDEISFDINKENDNCATITTENVLGIIVPVNGLFADWFTGCLREYYGKPVIGDATQKTMYYHFEKGILIKIEDKETWVYKQHKHLIKKY